MTNPNQSRQEESQDEVEADLTFDLWPDPQTRGQWDTLRISMDSICVPIIRKSNLITDLEFPLSDGCFFVKHEEPWSDFDDKKMPC